MANIEISTLTRNNDGNTYIIKDANAIPKTGSNQISGDLIPATDNSIDIGSSTNNIKMLYTKGITIDAKTIDTDANGNLVYDGNIIDTIEEQGDRYIRYSNGIQICFSKLNALNSEIEKQITFPKPFVSSPAVLVCGQTSYLYLNGWNTTYFLARVDGGATIYFSCIAIGTWK